MLQLCFSINKDSRAKALSFSKHSYMVLIFRFSEHPNFLIPLLSLCAMFLGWLHKNTRVGAGRCVFGRSKWSFMGKSRVHKRPCNFPCTNIEYWEAKPRWTWLLWRSRGLQACVREHFLKCHILPDTPPPTNTTLRGCSLRLWRKQFPTEHLMRLLDYGPPLRLKVAPMIFFFSPQNIQENQDKTIKQLSMSLLRGCDTPKNATRNPRFDNNGSC